MVDSTFQAGCQRCRAAGPEVAPDQHEGDQDKADDQHLAWCDQAGDDYTADSGQRCGYVPTGLVRLDAEHQEQRGHRELQPDHPVGSGCHQARRLTASRRAPCPRAGTPAHHHGRPEWDTITPNANPRGMNAAPTTQQPRNARHASTPKRGSRRGASAPSAVGTIERELCAMAATIDKRRAIWLPERVQNRARAQ
jgi:hypothetical protein